MIMMIRNFDFASFVTYVMILVSCVHIFGNLSTAVFGLRRFFCGCDGCSHSCNKQLETFFLHFFYLKTRFNVFIFPAFFFNFK